MKEWQSLAENTPELELPNFRFDFSFTLLFLFEEKEVLFFYKKLEAISMLTT